MAVRSRLASASTPSSLFRDGRPFASALGTPIHLRPDRFQIGNKCPSRAQLRLVTSLIFQPCDIIWACRHDRHRMVHVKFRSVKLMRSILNYANHTGCSLNVHASIRAVTLFPLHAANAERSFSIPARVDVSSVMIANQSKGARGRHARKY